MLTQHDMVGLAQKARELSRQCDAEKVPIDVKKIAQTLKLKVVPGSFKGTEISGLLIYKHGQYFIGYNEDDEEAKVRFTLAHEIAHFILHRSACHLDSGNEKSMIMFLDQAAKLGQPGQEVEANYFAACLLMPENQFREIHKEIREDKMSSGKDWAAALAERFKVTTHVIEYRKKNLRIDDL